MKRILIAFAFALVWITPGYAQDGDVSEQNSLKIRGISSMVSGLESSLNAKYYLHEQQIIGLKEDLTALKVPVSEIKDTRAKVSKQFDEIRNLRKELEDALTKFKEIEKVQLKLESEVEQAEEDAEAATHKANSTTWIVSAVSAIVSILVIVISLIFSSKFTDLTADSRINAALLKRIEKGLNPNHVEDVPEA